MTFDQFESGLSRQQPPEGLSPYLNALWRDRRGDWDAAHEIVQDISTKRGRTERVQGHRPSNWAAGLAAGSLDDHESWLTWARTTD